MGTGASACAVQPGESIPEGDTHVLSKDEIQEIFAHLSREYTRKLTVIANRAGKNRVKEVEARKKLFLKALGLVPDIEEQVRTKALDLLGDDGLVRQSQNALPENSKVTSKVVQQLGDVAVAKKKVKDKFGTNMTQEQINSMRQSEEEEKKEIQAAKLKELNEVVSAKPSGELQKVPTEKPIPRKARDVMGDENLEETAKRLVNVDTVTAKALKLAGEASLIANSKAARMIGSDLSQTDIIAIREQEDRERRKELNEKLHELNVILQTNPSLQQLEVKRPVSRKVQDRLGDEVAERGKNLIPEGTNVGKKQLQILGEEEQLLQGKLAKFRGGEMTAEQIKAMKKGEEAEQKKLAKQKQQSLHNLLKKEPSSAQLERPKELIGTKVALKKFGHEFLPERPKAS